jgi:hypothetical protein
MMMAASVLSGAASPLDFSANGVVDLVGLAREVLFKVGALPKYGD